MHEILFISGTVGLALLLWAIWHFANQHDQNNQNNQNGVKYFPVWVNVVVAMCFTIPVIVGMILSAVMHSHPYLLLLHHGCYGSYVSGQFGYVDLSISSMIKLSTIVGLNI